MCSAPCRILIIWPPIWLSEPLIDADLKKSDTLLNFHRHLLNRFSADCIQIDDACTPMLVYSKDTLTNMYVLHEC